MPRGQKICSKCGTATGPRTKICKSCGQPFAFKPPQMRQPLTKPIHWRELIRNDIIKVIKGSGPYWLNQEGEKICMGYGGKFRVAYLSADGIHAYPIKARESGHCFIYMGSKKQSRTGLRIRSHKIRKLKQRKTND